MSLRTRNVLYLVITAIMWSSGGLLIKSIPLNPMVIAGMRSFGAAIILGLFVRTRKINNIYTVIIGPALYCVTLFLFVMANKMTTAANTIILHYTSPIWVACSSFWFLREKVRFVEWGCIILVFFGSVLFFLDDVEITAQWGNLLALLSGLSFAGFIISLRKQNNDSQLFSVFLGNLLTALVSLPFLNDMLYDLKPVHWLLIFCLSVFQLGIPYVLYCSTVKHLKAIELNLIPSIELVLNPLWVFILIGEQPSAISMVGGFIIITSIVFFIVYTARFSAKNNPV